MRRLALFLFAFLSLPLSVSAAFKELAPGLEYEARSEFSAHVFRIDLKKFRFDVLASSSSGKAAMTAEEYRKNSGAVLTVNGGFFDAGFQGLGLLYRKGRTVSPLRPAAWGIFAVSGESARILHRNDWNPKGVTVALQAGPRLVVDGAVQTFKESGPARRSGVCVASDGSVEIAVSERRLLLSEWAEFLSKDCPNALDLDGGGSTQIYAEAGDFSLKVGGATAVPNALGVFPRR